MGSGQRPLATPSAVGRCRAGLEFPAVDARWLLARRTAGLDWTLHRLAVELPVSPWRRTWERRPLARGKFHRESILSFQSSETPLSSPSPSSPSFAFPNSLLSLLCGLSDRSIAAVLLINPRPSFTSPFASPGLNRSNIANLWTRISISEDALELVCKEPLFCAVSLSILITEWEPSLLSLLPWRGSLPSTSF